MVVLLYYCSPPLPSPHYKHNHIHKPQTHQHRSNASWVSTPHPPLGIDGPYGRISIPLEDYPRLLLVGGGVGVTPLTSTLRWLWAEVRGLWLCGGVSVCVVCLGG